MLKCIYYNLFAAFFIAVSSFAEHQHWSENPRTMRYQPDHGDFVIVNGEKRFNRALYGSNTGFRVEAGDLPEFALYMPRLGGTLRLGIIRGDQSKWMIEADQIEARYNNGSMRYTISDELLDGGELKLKLLALADADGMILKMEGEDLPEDVQLFWVYGGASDKRFSREGDLGADPESVFYLKPEHCADNEYKVDVSSFSVHYGKPDNRKCIQGIVPFYSIIRVADAANQANPLEFMEGTPGEAPAICGYFQFTDREPRYLMLADNNGSPDAQRLHKGWEQLFSEAEAAREELAKHFRVNTPDEYINAAANALPAAADGVWDGEAFMHGAVAWRMPLNGWRGAYAADCLGWPDRAETHFRGYFKAQYTDAPDRPSEPNPKTHLARQKEEAGTTLFSDGYISRRPGKINKPHHYDMNLVFIDQLLWHYRWTGDVDFIRESWPVLERHLAWEKRNFDANDDGLYDSYAAIWASDALQYSGGGVTHSSAYNYRANTMAAELAPLVGKDPAPYAAEAAKIKKAVNEQLWLADKGWFAEYKDALGLQRVHPSAAVWTIYHVIDEGLATPEQAMGCTEYVDHYIPHIPIEGEGLPEGDWYTISTSSWMPYTWSINNVALAEVLHTALAYWQAGRSEEAFTLTKSSILDYMFMGSSPGNYGQLSYYDAFRGELYRDFADPVGVASRVYVEGLFGFTPDLLNGEIALKPGWPADWEFAELETPYLKIDFRKGEKADRYTVENRFGKPLKLNFALPCTETMVESIFVNGAPAEFTYDESAIGCPVAVVQAVPAEQYAIEVTWSDQLVDATFPSLSETDRVPAEIIPVPVNAEKCEPVAIPFNDSVTSIFKEQYLSPRAATPTLSIPVQGIGDWCSYKETAEIDDSGIREKGSLVSPQGVPFKTPAEGNNIFFTSQWDVYPESAEVPLSGKASYAWLLMAGSVHHMQINMVNGTVEACYTDGSSDTLELRSPDNWWPIEQDYFDDGCAFSLPAPRPPRLLLKTGEWSLESGPILSKNHTKKIDGGAATLLGLSLDPTKELKCLRLKTLSNDLVIGLMAVTLQRE